MSGKRNRMPGLRQKGGIWYIEKRCRHVPGGWLRGSTGTSSRTEAERILIRKLADVLEEAKRRAEAILLEGAEPSGGSLARRPRQALARAGASQDHPTFDQREAGEGLSAVLERTAPPPRAAAPASCRRGP